MKISNIRKRKAISPVLATVILIAITLIAAIAIAGFVFGLFGTFTGGQNLQLVNTSCTGGAAGTAFCQLQLANTGGASASVTGCSLYGAAVTSATTKALAEAGTQTTVPVPAGTTSSAPVSVWCSGPAVALTSGSAVSGSLTVASGSPLAFSAIAA
jgi:archaeal type IV pilus assembly protein PilA